MRLLTIILTLFATCGSQAADVGEFQLMLDAENAFLPSRLAWREVDLLDPAMTLNFTFTDFMHRSKYYREENRAIWAGKDDARFVVDVDLKGATPTEDELDGFRAWTVSYASSYAAIKRRIMLHPTTDHCRIVYNLTFTKDTVIHEPIYFGPMLRPAAGFTVRGVPDVDTDTFALLEASGFKGGQLSFSPLNPGPILLRAPNDGTAMLVSYTWSGDIPNPMITRLWEVESGQSVSVTVDLRLAASAETLMPEMKRLATAMAEPQTAFLMVANADILAKLDRIPEAEAMLLRSAQADTSFAAPFSRLANLRRNPKSEATLTTAEAFTYASYRQPYNYGWSLSGLGFPKDKRLTEEERRLAIFNLLITVENCQFYPDYYIWVARHFEDMKMYAQAAAMTRQAIWALDRLPRPKEYRDKQRARMSASLESLERRLIDDPTAILPPLIEIDLRGRETP